MKIYDISQELFTSVVYPGDIAPEKVEKLRMKNGALYNLTEFSMCAHNGTHIDAPFHFIADGKTIDEVPLHKTVGTSYVASFDGTLTADDAKNILDKAQNANADAAKRILLKGKLRITEEAASVFADARLDALGVESQSVGPDEAPMAVHKILLSAEVIPIEGLRLNSVSDGVYFLSAAPINLGGSDGSPCRAILIEL